jgi:hypothetical protein
MSKKKVVKRYEWEDALIEAHAMGVLGRGDLFTALRLCHAITWVPKDGGGSALRWKNETAARVVGVGRATLYRAKGLKRHGYLIEHNKNLYPVIPESHNEIREAFVERRDKIKAEAKSQTDTEESHNETTKSQTETGKSQSDNPYSVDIYPVGVSPVDVGTVPSVADAPEAAISDSHEPERTSDSDTSSESTSSGIPEFENDSISESHISERSTHLGPTTTGPVDNAPVRDVETCESSSTPEAAAEIDHGPMSKKMLESAIERLRFSCINQDRRNIYNFRPENRRNIVLRAGKPEFYNLSTAEERIEAALTAMLAERSTK